MNKKQKITTALIAGALVIGGTTAGIVNHNNAVHAQQLKATQAKEKAAKVKADKLKAEKEAETQAEKAAQAQLMATEKAPTTDNIQKSEAAISKVKTEKVKADLKAQLKAIQSRVALENTAKAKTTAYQVDAMNTEKYNQAKTAISKLTSSYSTALKNKLTQDLEASKAQADNARKAQSEAKAAETAKQTQASSQGAQSSQNTSSQDNGDYYGQSQASAGQASAPSYTAPAAQAPAQSIPSNNGGGNAPIRDTNPDGTPTLDQANKDVENANNAGTGNAVNKEPGAKW